MGSFWVIQLEIIIIITKIYSKLLKKTKQTLEKEVLTPQSSTINVRNYCIFATCFYTSSNFSVLTKTYKTYKIRDFARDGETNVFLCEPKTFLIFRLRDQDRDFKTVLRKNQDCETCRTIKKNKTARHVKFDYDFASI